MIKLQSITIMIKNYNRDKIMIKLQSIVIYLLAGPEHDVLVLADLRACARVRARVCARMRAHDVIVEVQCKTGGGG